MPKPDPALLDRLERHLAGMPANRRPMFGTASWFHEDNRQMFASVWGDSVAVRLGREAAERLVADGEAGAFAPMEDRPMREYVLLPSSAVAEETALAGWLERACAFAATLEAREPRKKARPASAAPTTTRRTSRRE